MLDNENEIAFIGTQIFTNIPYVIEIRCLLDWFMMKTSLDLFQSFSLFYYHLEIFTSLPANNWYVMKKLGEPPEKVEKCVMGCLFSWIIMALVFGPFILFSESSPFVADNPVKHGAVALNFMVNKTMVINSINNKVYQDDLMRKINESTGDTRIFSSIRYEFFSNKNLFFRTL